MAATTDNATYPPKSVYNRQHSTEGHTQTVSSGAFGLFESGSLLDMRGNFKNPVVLHTSNSTMMSNYGFKIVNSTMDIKIALAPPVTGSHVKIVMTTTDQANDESVIQFIVSNDGGTTNARLGCTTGRMITYSTQNTSKLGWNKYLELVGTTQINGRRMWLVSNYARTTEIDTAFLVSSATD